MTTFLCFMEVVERRIGLSGSAFRRAINLVREYTDGHRHLNLICLLCSGAKVVVISLIEPFLPKVTAQAPMMKAPRDICVIQWSVGHFLCQLR